MRSLAASAGLAFIASLIVGGPVFAEELAPRAPGAKLNIERLRAQPKSDQVTVKFEEGLKVRLRGGAFAGLEARQLSQLHSALAAAGVSEPRFKRLHSRDEEALDRERAEAEAESGEKAADRNLYYTLILPAGADAADAANALNTLPFIEFATPAPRPAPPPVDIFPRTKNYTSRQGYLKDRGRGVGSLDPKRYRGADGRGMRFADVEYSWALDHEDIDIPLSRLMPHVSDVIDPFNSRDHGTAVLGEVIGRANRYGVTGLAPAAMTFVAGANTASGGYNPANAISLAAGKLRAGDVILIEQQFFTCGLTFNDPYGPLETLQDVFDEIKVATNRGIIVVQAAGNGSVDLDAPNCNRIFDRSFRDSGAIIVGAGTSGGRQKMSFSSYGSRVDVQGWGENVTTTGYGDLFNPGDERQWYTAKFSGTSSASPIVAGAILQIQGVLKACGKKPLRPAAMRKLLVKTGARQIGGGGKIGPLPQILKALKATTARACVTRAAMMPPVAQDEVQASMIGENPP